MVFLLAAATFIKFWGALSSSTVCPLRFLPFEVLQTKHVFKIIK